jgi:hypothetical protein
MPNTEYKIDPTNSSYVSEETYLKLLKEGRVNQPSPYLVGKYEVSESIRK